MYLTQTVLCSVQDKLWARAAGVGDIGCWLWTKHVNEDGYGVFQFRLNGQKRKIRAHRAAYIIVRGNLNEDIVLRHNCDVKHCINPWHTTPGTHDDNVQDKVIKDRQAKGIDNGRAILSESDVIAIRAELSKGVQKPELAVRYGVDRKTIYLIEHGLIWKHL